jgi:hypothetical protein
MKKLLALAASLLVAGSAFAAGSITHIAPNATFAFGSPGIASGPTTTNNDDACDISVAPAATLLLPYFEVDFVSTGATARTTLFTITNTSRVPQIAHVVIWTDWSFAALDFNIFLTGYDVQSINLYDVFNRGIIAPVSASAAGTSISNATLSPVGTAPPNQPNAAPLPNTTGNPNFQASAATTCVNLPGPIGQTYLADIQRIFTTGQPGSVIGAGCSASTRLGGTHTNAIGYITVDVDSTCSTSLPGPTTPGQTYSSSEILFDNVLIGDYQDVNPNSTTGNYAGGNPMVHIRAVPEGGPVGSNPGTNLPFTFYDRYNFGGPLGSPGTPLTNGTNRLADRRQPLPSVFAARWIQGGTSGFNTNYKIWREGVTGPNSTSCTGGAPAANSALAITELVRFDEHENSNSVAPQVIISPAPPTVTNVLPETSSTSTSSSIFPGLTTSGDLGGWMYLNLNNGGPVAPFVGVYSSPALDNPIAHPTFTTRASQNWVIISMFAEGRYSVDYDAAWLGNGCSAPVGSGATIGPVGGTPVCPAGATGCTPGVAPYIGTNVTP